MYKFIIFSKFFQAHQKFYTWAGTAGQDHPKSRLGDYDIPTGNANVISDLAPHQNDIKEVAGYIANRFAYPAYDAEDAKPYKYEFRTRRRKAEGAAEAEPEEKRGEPAKVIEKPLIDNQLLIKKSNPRAPFFEHGLRSHTIWENMTVKFTCRVDGNPAPLVTWYHNMIPIEPTMCEPGKFKITERNGVNTLEVSK
jgi:hypothetical protein